MKQWKYHTLVCTVEEGKTALNALGRKGWELISAHPYNNAQYVTEDMYDLVKWVYVLKKLVEGEWKDA